MQHTVNWDARFLRRDTPWEDRAVAPVVARLFGEWVAPGATVLDVGCGLGLNSIWLAEHGYRVTACDISAEAIRIARQRAGDAGASVTFIVANLLTDAARLPRTDVVFDRGVLHTFANQDGRNAFAAAIASLLDPGKLWLDISGSADQPEDAQKAIQYGYPRLTLASIATAVEPYFEVLEARQAVYGGTGGQTDFLAFACAFRKR